MRTSKSKTGARVLHLCKLAAGEAQHHDEPRRNFRAPLAARKSKAYHHPEADHHAEKRACVRPRPEHYGWFTFMATCPQVSSCACRPASCCRMTASTAITCALHFPNTAIFRRAKKPLFDRLRPSTASATSNSPAWQTSPASRIFRRGPCIPTSSKPARSRPQTRRSTACI